MDKDSFEAVYTANFSYIYNYIYMRVLHKETTEDLTSQTFLNALKNFASYDSSLSSERTWLCRIAEHLVIDHMRSFAVKKTDLYGEDCPELPVYDSCEIFKDDVNKEVARLLSGLKSDERELLSLRFALEMPITEIAKNLGISPNAAGKRIKRILEKCRMAEGSRNLSDFIS